MNEFQKTGFAERLKTAAEARQALVAKLKPKPTVTDPQFEDRAARKDAELAQVRADRAAARAAAKQAIADSEAAALEAAAALDAEALEAKRGERKERKQLTKVEQKAKRDARYAARKAR